MPLANSYLLVLQIINATAFLELIIATSHRKKQLDARVIGGSQKFNIASQQQDANDNNNIFVITFLQNSFIVKIHYYLKMYLIKIIKAYEIVRSHGGGVKGAYVPSLGKFLTIFEICA